MRNRLSLLAIIILQAQLFYFEVEAQYGIIARVIPSISLESLPLEDHNELLSNKEYDLVAVFGVLNNTKKKYYITAKLDDKTNESFNLKINDDGISKELTKTPQIMYSSIHYGKGIENGISGASPKIFIFIKKENKKEKITINDIKNKIVFSIFIADE